jgi:XTP/dITP diphosphohydrolase
MRQRVGAKLIIATRNEGKVKEFAALFKAQSIDVVSLRHFQDVPEIVEDGETFADNALIKARTIALALGVPVIADDSGLCVDRLNGEPGVYSARYAGEHATDEQNNIKLLEELRVLPLRSVEQVSHDIVSLSPAQFVCAICLVDAAGGIISEAQGHCSGEIIAVPRGEHGFGYDPLFYIPAYNQTMAELSLDHKNEISHRGQAIRALWQSLQS